MSDEPEPLFDDRDEKFMRAFLDLAVKWADERPDAAPTGLSIMGTTLLSVALQGPELDPSRDDQEVVEMSSKAKNLLAQGKPHDALDVILTRTDPNYDRPSDEGTDDDSSDEERTPDGGGA